MNNGNILFDDVVRRWSQQIARYGWKEEKRKCKQCLIKRIQYDIYVKLNWLFSDKRILNSVYILPARMVSIWPLGAVRFPVVRQLPSSILLASQTFIFFLIETLSCGAAKVFEPPLLFGGKCAHFVRMLHWRRACALGKRANHQPKLLKWWSAFRQPGV